MRTDDATETSEPRSRFRALTRFVSDRIWHARPTKFHTRWQAITLIALCLAVYVPGLFTIPPIDRDESRFAQASRQMFESIALPEAKQDPAMHSGGLAVPYVIDKPRLNKPPLIYWIQTVSAATFTLGNPLNDAIWMYRLPSAIFATLTVLMTWRIGLLLFDARAAWLGAATLAICPLVVIDAHQGRADQLMVACTTAAMWALAGIVKRSQTREVPFRLAIGLAIAVAAGVLAKGPITPMVVALAIVAYAIMTKRFRWILSTHPWLAVLVTAITIGPWIYFVARHFGFAEYKALVFDETIGRSAAPKEGHWGPPGYHLLLLPVLFWPGSLGVALAFVHVFKRRVGWRPARWQEAFLVAWILPAWIVFELVSTKLPHYTMPMYPAVALLCARALCNTSMRSITANSLVLKGLIGLWLLIPLTLFVVCGTFAIRTLLVQLITADPLNQASNNLQMIPTWTHDLVWGINSFALAVVATVMFGSLLWLARHKTDVSAIDRLLRTFSIAWITSLLSLMQFLLPSLNSQSLRTRETLLDQGWQGETVILGEYHEDSLIFQFRGAATRYGRHGASVRKADPTRFAVLGRRFPWPEATVTEVRGISLGGGFSHVYVISPDRVDDD